MRKWYIFEENSQIWKSKNKLESRTIPGPNYEHTVKGAENFRSDDGDLVHEWTSEDMKVQLTSGVMDVSSVN